MAHDSTFRSLTRYEEYYLPGGDLFLLVEHHVFRVHRYFFERESIYFKGKLATPPSPGTTRPGTSESNAILLDDVRVHEFARFLWVFYNPKYSLYHASVADWVGILTLAHRWSFPEVKELAVRELEKLAMPDIERVVVYQDNEVDRNLLIPCYAALCERDEPITPAEGRQMGIDTALMIAQLREMARRSPVDCRSPIPANFRGNDLFSLVRELFGIAPLLTEDDSVPQTPLGGPPPPLWFPSPQTVVTPRSTARLQQTMQTITTAAPPPPPFPPPRMATLTPAQEPEPEPATQQDPTPAAPPTPPPKKPERPQVITGLKAPLDKKLAGVTDPSRPSTPASETPTTETPNPDKTAKKTKKKKAKKGVETPVAGVAGTGIATPKAEEKADAEEPPATEAVAAAATEQAAAAKENEEKKDEGQALVGVGEKKDDSLLVSLEKSEAGTSGVQASAVDGANGSAKGDEQQKTNGVAGGDGVSTDLNITTTDLPQVNDQKLVSPLADHKLPVDPLASPTTPKKGPWVNLKSPQEKQKSLGMLDSFLKNLSS